LCTLQVTVLRCSRPTLTALTGLLLWALPAGAASTDRLDVTVRSRTVSLIIYEPKATSRGTIIMGSGDVGWVGLAVSMAEELSAQGYLVVGLNVRQYLSEFTSGSEHLQPADVAVDYRVFADLARQKLAAVRPFVVAGVSEGAALAVLAASDPKNHAWIDGAITVGLPATAELAWHWSDLWAAAMKKNADEPSFTVTDYLPRVGPVPLCMIQSKNDEYVPPSDYERFRARAVQPSRLVLIDASNHRFTDRRPELSRAFADGLAWIRDVGRR
jgi:type IV secretory pathway VirJ component